MTRPRRWSGASVCSMVLAVMPFSAMVQPATVKRTTPSQKFGASAAAGEQQLRSSTDEPSASRGPGGAGRRTPP